MEIRSLKSAWGAYRIRLFLKCYTATVLCTANDSLHFHEDHCLDSVHYAISRKLPKSPFFSDRSLSDEQSTGALATV